MLLTFTGEFNTFLWCQIIQQITAKKKKSSSHKQNSHFINIFAHRRVADSRHLSGASLVEFVAACLTPETVEQEFLTAVAESQREEGFPNLQWRNAQGLISIFICDTIKGNESRVENINFYFLIFFSKLQNASF